MYEYRRVYNRLADEGDDIAVDCRIERTREVDTDYDVLVCCTGTVKDNDVYDDYPPSCYTYRVTADGTSRRGDGGTAEDDW